MTDTETHKVVLDINGKDARAELERQRKMLEMMKEEAMKIAESLGTESQELKDIETKIHRAEKALKKYEAGCIEITEILNKLDVANSKELEKTNKNLTAQLNNPALKRMGEEMKNILTQIGPVRQEQQKLNAEMNAFMATVSNVGDMTVNELTKAQRALTTLLTTQKKNSEAWKLTGTKIMEVQQELDQANAAQKRFLSGADQSPIGKSVTELKRMKSALEESLTVQKHGTSEWIVTNQKLQEVNKELRQAEIYKKQLESGAFGSVDGKSKEELVKMKQVLKETLDAQVEGTTEWKNTHKQLEKVSAAIEKVELNTKKTSKYAVINPKGLPLADLNKMEKTLKDIVKQEQEGTKAWGDAQKKLREVKEEIYRVELETKKAAVDVQNVLKNVSGANLHDLRATLEVLNKEINSPNIKRGSEEWKRYNEQIKQVNAEIRTLEAESKETKSWIDRFNDGMNNWQTTIAASVAALMGLYQQLVEMRNFSFAKEDATSKLKAITGLDDKSIFWLRDQAQKLSTEMDNTGMRVRQSTAEIMDAFRLVGSNKPELLKDREGLYEVTKEVIRLAQASNMELQPTVLSLTTALNQFGQGAEAARKYVNALAAGSKYGAADVENQAKVIVRSGVAANLAKISFEDLVAATETLAETGLKGERAGTSMKTVLTRMELGAKECRPSIVGLDKALENMAGRANDVNWLKKTFGLWSYSAAKTLIDHRESLKKYRKAVTDTTVAEEQAAIMGANSVAIHAQVVNKFKEMSDELYEMIGPGILNVTSKLVNWTRAVKEMVKWIIQHKELLAILALQYSILVVQMKAEVVAAKLVNTWNNVIVKGYKLLRVELAKMKTAGGVWIVIANLIMSAGLVLANYIKKQKDAVRAENEHQKAIAERVKEEESNNYRLYASYKIMDEMLHKQNLSMKEKLDIISKLNKAIPDYKGEIDKSTGAIKSNVKALDEWLKKQRLLSLQQIYNDEIVNAMQEKYEAEIAVDKARKKEHELFAKWYILKSNPDATYNGANAFSPNPGMHQATQWELVDKDYQAAIVELQIANQRKAKADEALNELEKKVGDIQEKADRLGAKFTYGNSEEPDMTNISDGQDIKLQEKIRREKEAARQASEEAKLKLAESLKSGAIDKEKYDEDIYEEDIKLLDKYIEIMAKYYGKDSANYKDAQNDKTVFIRKHIEDSIKEQEKKNKSDEKEERKEIKDKLDKINAESTSKIAAAKKVLNAELANGESKEAAELRFDQKIFEIEQNAFDKKMALYKDDSAKYQKYEAEKAKHFEDYVNKIQSKTIDIQNKLFAKDSSRYNYEIDILNEALNKKLIAEKDYTKAIILLRQKETDAVFNEVTKQNNILNIKNSERVKNIQNAYNEELNKQKQLLEQGKITEVQYAEYVKNLKIQKNNETYAVYQTSLKNWLSKYSSVIQQLQSLMNQYSSMVQSDYEAQIASVEARYDYEIKKAEKAGKDTTSLEKKKTAATLNLQIQAAEAQHKADVAQALMNVAMSITNAYAQYPYYIALALTPLLTAMGAMQVSTLNQQYQAKKTSLESSRRINAEFYNGGYTRGSNYKKSAGIVHEGEFVANHEAVNNPSVRPYLDLIDFAQRNNRVASLSSEDLAMANKYNSGGVSSITNQSNSTVLTPNVKMPSQEILTKAIQELNYQLSEGIRADVSITGKRGIKRQEKRYQQILNNKSRL